MSKRSIFSPVADFFGDVGRARRAIRAYERYRFMSEERLAQRGLAREDIALAAYEAAFAKYRD